MTLELSPDCHDIDRAAARSPTSILTLCALLTGACGVLESTNDTGQDPTSESNSHSNTSNPGTTSEDTTGPASNTNPEWMSIDELRAFQIREAPLADAEPADRGLDRRFRRRRHGEAVLRGERQALAGLRAPPHAARVGEARQGRLQERARRRRVAEVSMEQHLGHGRPEAQLAPEAARSVHRG